MCYNTFIKPSIDHKKKVMQIEIYKAAFHLKPLKLLYYFFLQKVSSFNFFYMTHKVFLSRKNKLRNVRC